MHRNEFAFRRLSRDPNKTVEDGPELKKDLNYFRPSIYPDNLEAELTLLIAITTLQSSVLASFPKFYSIDDLVAFDESNTWLSYDLADVLTVLIWVGLQFNVLPCFLSWIIYLCWRSVRPVPEDKKTTQVFYDRFHVAILFIYFGTIAGFVMMSLCYFHLIVLKTGIRSSNANLNTVYYVGVGYFIGLVAIVVACIVQYFKVKRVLNLTKTNGSVDCCAAKECCDDVWFYENCNLSDHC